MERRWRHACMVVMISNQGIPFQQFRAIAAFLAQYHCFTSGYRSIWDSRTLCGLEVQTGSPILLRYRPGWTYPHGPGIPQHTLVLLLLGRETTAWPGTVAACVCPSCVAIVWRVMSSAPQTHGIRTRLCITGRQTCGTALRYTRRGNADWGPQ